MKTTDKNFVEEIKKQAAPHMQELANGKTARDIAKDIYLTLPEKTEEIAYMMTDNMAELIENYHDEFDACYADEDAYITAKLEERTKDIEDQTERCKVYHRMLTALTAHAIYCEGGEDAEARAKAYLEEHKDFDCTAEEAAKQEAELFALTVDTMKQADILMVQLPAVLEQIQNEEFNAAAANLAFGRESADLKLVFAMQAYVNAQNGLYEDISEESSMEQIVYSVCGAADTCAVAAQAEEGTVDEPTAIKILKAIGCVLGFVCTLCADIVASLILAVLLNAILPIPFLLSSLLAVLAVTALDNALSFEENAEKTGANLLAGIGYMIGYATGAVVKGVKKLTEWAAPYVTGAISWIKDKVCSLLARLSNVFTRGEKEQAAEIISTHAVTEEPAAEVEYEEDSEEQDERNIVFA